MSPPHSSPVRGAAVAAALAGSVPPRPDGPHLPAPLTSLVGRDDDAAHVAQLLASTRLLTLTGAGGSGKTRLAIEVARRAADAHREGAAWVDLAPLADPDLLATHIGTALHLELGARPAIDSLLDGLHGREQLLVLDNCEHLVDACATLVEQLLAHASGLRILATSREALGAAGERAWLVPTLAVPEGRDGATPEQVLASPAGRLFVERAGAAHAAFRLTADNAPAIAAICRRLDGLPLAIELAAARVRALTPGQIAARLDTAFHVLTSAPRATVSRHRTLGEAIDWSYALLEEGDRVVLQRLSVFTGDFSLEAAEAVCAPTPDDAVEILDRLVTLVDKSLVMMVEGDGTARYRLLETIRQYAAARLDVGGDADAVRARHARYYLSLVLDAEPHFITGDRRLWVDRVVREMDHLRAALAWTRTHAPAQCVQLAGALCWVWYSSGLWFEGRRWLETVLAFPPAQAPTAARGAALLAAGVLAGWQGQPDVAQPWLDEAAAIFRAEGDAHREAYALAYLGVTIGQRGDAAAVPASERALATFRALGDLYGQRMALLVLVTMRIMAGDLAGARTLAEKAVQVARAFGAPRELGIALQILGTVSFHQGDVARAGALMREALDELQLDPQALWVARVLELLAMVAVARGQHVHATRIFAAAEAHRALIGATQFALDRQRLAPFINRAREALGDEAFASAWADGAARAIGDAINDAQQVEAEAARAAPPSTPPPAPATPPATATRADVTAETGRPPVLDVAALGPLEIRRDGVTPADEVWRYARARELLLYLLSNPEGRTCEQLGLVFWPEATQAQVKNSFHVLLHHLRRSLGRADLITFDRNRYRIAWELGVRFDAFDFEREATEALRAVQRDDVDALIALGRRAQRAGAPAEAAASYRRVVRADPLNRAGIAASCAPSRARGSAARRYSTSSGSPRCSSARWTPPPSASRSSCSTPCGAATRCSRVRTSPRPSRGGAWARYHQSASRPSGASRIDPARPSPPTRPVRVLFAEDDRQLRESVARGLREASYVVDLASDGTEALALARERNYDVIILDILMAGASGLEVCRAIRAAENSVPILMLTALDAIEHRITGLDAGADDYLTKPFDFGELLARLRALTRRRGEVLSPELVIGDLVIDTTRHLVRRGSREIPLTTKEFTFLHHLARHAGRVVSRAELMEHVWEDKSNTYSNIIDVYASRLRRKIEEGDETPLVVTLRGTGFMLNVPADHPAARPDASSEGERADPGRARG